MPRRKVIYSIILALFIITFIPAGIIHSSESKELKVIFFDVGQGDSALIEQGSKQILIDGGPDGKKVMEKLGEYVPFWDRNIEVVIATHPDEDHISGLTDVMENYNIGEVIDNGVNSDTQIYKKFKDIIAQKGIGEIEGKAGMDINIGENIKMKIISPDGTEDKNNPKDTNLSSIVTKLTYGDKSFLFTGDFPTEGEPTLISKNFDLHSQVLKVAHHGSKYATSDEFLDKVHPEEAVISVGKNNRYGHPAQEVLDRLNAHKIKILRTDERGDVEYDL